MFFEDHLKKVYRSPVGTDHDPLAVQRTLVDATGNRLNALLADWQAVHDDGRGEIRTPETVDKFAVLSVQAEGKLVKAARVAFGVKPFPEQTDAEALECLCDFLEWCEKKGERGPPPPP